MTLSTFIPTNATTLTPASNRRAPTRRAAANVGRIFRNPAAAIGKAIVIIIAYRVALKRLEAGVEGNLFDEPVLWAELKSVAGPRLARPRTNGRTGFLLSAPLRSE